MNAELMIMMDETMGIWKDNKGYYFYDRFCHIKSEYFENVLGAMVAANDLLPQTHEYKVPNASNKHKCTCDYDTVVRIVGCKCGGV